MEPVPRGNGAGVRCGDRACPACRDQRAAALPDVGKGELGYALMLAPGGVPPVVKLPIVLGCEQMQPAQPGRCFALPSGTFLVLGAAQVAAPGGGKPPGSRD